VKRKQQSNLYRTLFYEYLLNLGQQIGFDEFIKIRITLGFICNIISVRKIPQIFILQFSDGCIPKVSADIGKVAS